MGRVAGVSEIWQAPLYSLPGSSVFTAREEKMIRKGDRVRIRRDWQDKGDEAMTWVARSDEDKGRIDISALELKSWPIWPVQTVSVETLEIIDKNNP